MSEVVKLKLVSFSEELRLDVDEMLENTKGQPFETIAIIGEMEDGTLWISGNANAGETLILMEKAKRQIIFDD